MEGSRHAIPDPGGGYHLRPNLTFNGDTTAQHEDDEKTVVGALVFAKEVRRGTVDSNYAFSR